LCQRFVFLLITQVAAWLRLSRRENEVEDRGDLDCATSSPHRSLSGAAPFPDAVLDPC
jgi:hypothetical protein